MKYGIYLLNMSMSGIKNIHNEIQIDFYGKNIDKNFNPEKYKIKGIYGENGSGKTAIITAVDVVRNFVMYSNYLQDSQSQKLLGELINKESSEFIFQCEYTVGIDYLHIFKYEVHLTVDENGEIFNSYEALSFKKNNSKNTSTTIFVCKNGEIEELYASDEARQLVYDKTRNLLSKQSAMSLFIRSCINEKNTEDFVILLAIAQLLFMVIITHFDREDKHLHYYQSIRLKELKRDDIPAESLLEEISESISTNERRIPTAQFEQYQNKVRQLERFVRLFKPELKGIEIEKRDDKDYYNCELILDYGTYKVNREFESTGIKKIIELFDVLKGVSGGFIGFIDEMDSNINDIYLCKIIEYFNYYGEGQLCFTSHNPNPMSILKKNSKAIDFLTRDNRIVPWVKNGNYSPDNSYRNGMIDGMPFNIDSSDFISIFEGEE